MGTEMSWAQMEGLLRDLLKANGMPLKTKTARLFLKTVEEITSWFLDEGLLKHSSVGSFGRRFKGG